MANNNEALSGFKDIVFGKDRSRADLFTDIGKTLTAVSLGLQGRDPSSVFETKDNTLQQALQGANALALIGERDLAEQLIRSALGQGQPTKQTKPITSKTATIQAQPSSFPLESSTGDLDILPKSISQTQKGLGGTQTTTFDVERSPKEEGRRAGIEKGMEESFKSAQKLIGAIKQIDTLRTQFDEALPSDGRNPLLQRVNGVLSVFGAKTGLIPNDELLALKKNARPQAIQIIRKFGEVGNLSETEQRGALDILEQEGLTEQERAAQIKQFLQTALSSTPQEVREFLMEDPSVSGILTGLNIDVSKFIGKSAIDFDIQSLFKGVVSNGR